MRASGAYKSVALRVERGGAAAAAAAGGDEAATGERFFVNTATPPQRHSNENAYRRRHGNDSEGDGSGDGVPLRVVVRVDEARYALKASTNVTNAGAVETSASGTLFNRLGRAEQLRCVRRQHLKRVFFFIGFYFYSLR